MPKSTKDDEQKTERFNMFMSPSEMKAIDDWAWKNKIRSKSEAVRRLCQIGLLVGGELEGLADATIDMSDAMSGLDNEAFDFWAAIADPTHKTETLSREAVREEISAMLLKMSKVNGGVDQVSTLLVGLYAAAAGITRLEAGEARKRSEEIIQGVNESLAKLRAARVAIEENRRLMSAYSFKSAEADEKDGK